MVPFCSLIRLLLSTARVGSEIEKGALQPPEPFLYQFYPSEMLVLSSPTQHYPIQLYPTMGRGIFHPHPSLSFVYRLSSSAFITRVRLLQAHRDPIACVSRCDSSLPDSRNHGAERGSLQASQPTPPPPQVSSSAKPSRCIPAPLYTVRRHLCKCTAPPLLSTEHEASVFSSEGHPLLTSQEMSQGRARTREDT